MLFDHPETGRGERSDDLLAVRGAARLQAQVHLDVAERERRTDA